MSVICTSVKCVTHFSRAFYTCYTCVLRTRVNERAFYARFNQHKARTTHVKRASINARQLTRVKHASSYVRQFTRVLRTFIYACKKSNKSMRV